MMIDRKERSNERNAKINNERTTKIKTERQKARHDQITIKNEITKQRHT